LADLVAAETAGDPMNTQKWVRSSLRSLSTRLKGVGHAASPPTVGRLLCALGYSLKANRKERETGSAHPEREVQFQYLAAQRQRHQEAHLPIISVDTKKKELIGDFKNTGRDWCRQPEVVKVHDFPSEAVGRAIPYGIYDVQRNEGYMQVGLSADTPAFAVAAIRAWWEQQGRTAYPDAPRLLILADAGGSNACRSRGWKQQLQEHLCDALGLTVTVCHYPTGCSKWNPVEHRLFGPISINWAGHPLRTLETMLAYLRGTSTETGLRVTAAHDPRLYPKGQKVADAVFAHLRVTPHAVCPQWNYTVHPRSNRTAAALPQPVFSEVIS
jgi:hypothetical protein